MSGVIVTTGYYQNMQDGTYLPTINASNGIEKNIPFIDTSVTIPFPSNRTWDYYDEGEGQIMTWFDYSENCNELSTAQNFYNVDDFINKHTVLLNGFSDITEDELETRKNNFDADVSWLWGSLDEGGCFIIKSSSDPSTISSLSYRVYFCFGEMEREPENEDYSSGKYYYYIASLGSVRISLEAMRHVAWHLRADEDNVIIAGYFAGTNWYQGDVSANYGLTTPEFATNTAGWIAGLDSAIPLIETPAKAWYWEGGSDNLALYLRGFTLENTIWISGNPFSEDEFGSDPAGVGGNATGGGGYGTPAQDTGDVDGESADDLNQLSIVNSGFATLYNPTSTELQNFANFLYTGITDSISTQLKKLVTNPLDYLLFVALCKFNPPTSGRMEIGFGSVGSGVSAQKISNQFYELDCGTITYSEQFKSFLDYAPNSSVKIYLPFCGTHDLSIDDIMGSRINVNYLIDLLSGTCIARVKITRQVRSTAPQDARVNDVIYEFQGNVYLTAPISATDWRGAYQSLVGLAGGVVGGLASGGLAGATALVSSVASSVTSQKVSVGRSGQAGSNYGYLNNKKPYLILERPIQSHPANWGAFEGYTTNVRAKVSQLSGYTEIDESTLWTDFGFATDEETQMIKDIMNGGVYL